jgi:hypothetical protein
LQGKEKNRERGKAEKSFPEARQNSNGIE